MPELSGSPVEVELYAEVTGQEEAVDQLRAAAARPVHAYLLVGPAGTGKGAAARSFAASLLCGAPAVAREPQGGEAQCAHRVLEGTHPDVVTVRRDGPFITIDAAREIARLALRSPVEGDRKVLILEDFHLVRDAGPALLKTIEEPPASVVFVILAEFVPPELVTIASRCVRIDFRPLAPAEVVAALVADGVGPEAAGRLAEAAGGRLDRARLLAADPGFEARRQAWAAVPGRLDGTGATVAAIADELLDLLEGSVNPIRARQEAELADLAERQARAVAVSGKGSRRAAPRATKAGSRELEERHRREQRRQRTDELRAGLATLAEVYRDRAVAGGSGTVSALAAIARIQASAANLEFNPGELLALQALLAGLSQLSRGGPAKY